MEILKGLIAGTPMCSRQTILLYLIYLKKKKKAILLSFLESASESVIGMFLTLLYDLKASFLFSIVTLREVEKKKQ